MITFTIDDRQFRREMKRFRKKSESDFKIAILRATLQLEKLAKLKVRNFTRNAKVKSGFLINNIRKLITANGLTGEVTSGANYSQAFEEGTRPHRIRVINKKVLAGPYRGRPAGWQVSAKSKSMGYATYGKAVEHPGTPAHPYMFPAWRFACQQLEKLIKQALT
jgi:hypothetical protein